VSAKEATSPPAEARPAVAPQPRQEWGSREVAATTLGAVVSAVIAPTTWQTLSPSIPAWMRLALSISGAAAAFAAIAVIAGATLRLDRPSWDARRALSGGRRARFVAGLVGVLGVLALAPVLGPLAALKVALAAVLLFAPGYLLSRLLAPEATDGLGRLVMAWALSAGLDPLPLFLLNAAGIRFSLAAAAVSLLALSGALAFGVHREGAGRAHVAEEQVGSGGVADSERLLLTAGIVLTVLLALLPYAVQHSYFPFGRDYQHPINVEYLLTVGRPWPQPGFVHRVYPDTYGYFAAELAVLAGWTPLQVLKVLPVVSIVAGALSLYWATRGMFGARTAAFTLLAYGALSFQPRTNFFAGTYIDLVSGLTFVPLYFWLLVRTMRERSYRAPLLAGLLLGFIIQYHILTLTYAVAISILAVAMTLALHRGLDDRRFMRRLAALSGVAYICGLPYSVYYTIYYAQDGLVRLGVTNGSPYKVDFPAISFPSAFVLVGPVYVLLPLIAALVLFAGPLRVRRPGPAGILLICWLAVLFVGAFTKIFIDPNRPTYLLALPFAILLGLLANLAAGRFRVSPRDAVFGRRRRAGLFAVGALATLMAPCLVLVANMSVASASVGLFADGRDVPSLHALRQDWQAEGKPNVVTDESGLWADYYTNGQADVIPGGPAGFGMWYPYQQQRYLAFWTALQDPCSQKSIQTFIDYGVRLVYLGRRPEHWVKPGYVYNDGSALSSCPAYTVLYSEETPRGPIRIFRVDGRSVQAR
jgi:hypothetical protein